MFSTPISRKATMPATKGVSHWQLRQKANGRKIRYVRMKRDVCLHKTRILSCTFVERGTGKRSLAASFKISLHVQDPL